MLERVARTDKGKRMENDRRGGRGYTISGPGPGPYLAPPLFVAPQHCVSLHSSPSLTYTHSPSLSLSLSVSVSVSVSPSLSQNPGLCPPLSRPSLRDQQRVVSMIPSSDAKRRRGGEKEGETEGGTSAPRVTPFSPPWRRSGTCLSISSRAAASPRCGRVLKPARETGTSTASFAASDTRLGFARRTADTCCYLRPCRQTIPRDGKPAAAFASPLPT